MNTTQIKVMLERYYAGETTLEEERELTTFFEQENVSAALQTEQSVFQFYQREQQEKIVSDRLNLHFSEERSNQLISIRPLLKTFTAVAASLLIVTVAYYFTQQSNKSRHITYNQESDSQMAYLETKKALILISQKLNKGTKDLDKISKLNEVQTLLTPKN